MERSVKRNKLIVLGALLIAPQKTEFGAKVGLLSALTIACAARPLLERFLRDAAARSALQNGQGLRQAPCAGSESARAESDAVTLLPHSDPIKS